LGQGGGHARLSRVAPAGAKGPGSPAQAAGFPFQ
jgi:hypothetical protein